MSTWKEALNHVQSAVSVFLLAAEISAIHLVMLYLGKQNVHSSSTYLSEESYSVLAYFCSEKREVSILSMNKGSQFWKITLLLPNSSLGGLVAIITEALVSGVAEPLVFVRSILCRNDWTAGVVSRTSP